MNLISNKTISLLTKISIKHRKVYAKQFCKKNLNNLIISLNLLIYRLEFFVVKIGARTIYKFCCCLYIALDWDELSCFISRNAKLYVLFTEWSILVEQPFKAGCWLKRWSRNNWRAVTSLCSMKLEANIYLLDYIHTKLWRLNQPGVIFQLKSW